MAYGCPQVFFLALMLSKQHRLRSSRTTPVLLQTSTENECVSLCQLVERIRKRYSDVRLRILLTASEDVDRLLAYF